jgi:fructose-1,6-bisphosphatase/inositol monophosphatase family enzyme
MSATHFDRDVKLEADRAAEERILEVLRGASPFEVLAEEGGTRPGSDPDSGLRWIVDPLDGSMNFLRGIPLCCVSVGLWRCNEPLLGVVYDFNRDEIFTGIVGEGAYLNGNKIRVSQVKESRHATLCTGFPAATDFSADALGRFVAKVQDYKKVRLFGSAALSLAYVAAGRVDAYRERDIRIWDVAAGLALVMAAGGETVTEPTAVPHAMDVYASNEGLFAEYRNGS